VARKLPEERLMGVDGSSLEVSVFFFLSFTPNPIFSEQRYF